MSSKITIHNKDSENIYPNAAQLLIKSLKSHQKEKILILLSGGSVINLYKKLAGYIRSANIKNDSLVVGQVDERFKPENSKLETRNSNKTSKINSQIIGETGLWEVCNKKSIPYYLVSQEGTLEESAEKYDQTISKLFKEYTYKIAVLGIGEDGHTAGLLPGYEKAWNIDKFVVGYKIDDGQNKAMAISCPNIFRQRITVTPKTLQDLDQVLVVASGENKKEAIREILDPVNENNINKYPAVLLQKIKEVDLFTDIKLV